MSEKFELSLGEYLKTIQRGEVVLVEYTSDEPIHLILHMILRYLKRENIPVVILDVLDHLHMFRNHLKFAGVPTDLIDEARVIKIGGIISDRNVLGKIDLTEDPAVMRTKYHKTLEQLANEHEYFVRVGLGDGQAFENGQEPWDLEVLLGTVSRPMIGHEKSWGDYFR
ncbi:DUF257 family protein [Thermococcus peptonophilus]|uniref:DUF257 family protein n=1 Tax=Thermococcus peptonophilus TaxID=53952 RepID=UPI0006D0F24B